MHSISNPKLPDSFKEDIINGLQAEETQMSERAREWASSDHSDISNQRRICNRSR